MLRESKGRVYSIKAFIFAGWVLIPLIITVLGFADPIVGAILFAISIFKIAMTFIKHFGNPNKWIPGHKEKAEKERKMRHYYHHCELNPEAFTRLKLANFANEED